MITKKHIYIIGIIATASLFSSCDFEKVNTNEFELRTEEGKMDGITLGGPITAMQKCVVPIGTQADGTKVANQYQIAYHLSADCWSGYFSQNEAWNNGYNNTSYYLHESWLSASYRSAYSNIIPLWKEVMLQAKETNSPEVAALAQVIKIASWHKAVDMFGPIPYKEAGKGLLVVPYDSEKEVYTLMMKELTDAIEVLTKKANADEKLLEAYDAVYKGNAIKWVKYANSLLLRLAMRVRYVDVNLAKKYAEQAVQQQYGVMTDKEDAAKMDKGAGLNFRNNLTILTGQYKESRMGSTMLAYLGGYQDPRIKVYFTETTSPTAVTVGNLGMYQALPPAVNKAKNTEFEKFSEPNVQDGTPTYWMKASEVYFLRAEGALLGWDMKGTAEALYKKGVETSFEENGLSAALAEHYLTSGLSPMKFNLKTTAPYVSYSQEAPTTATTAFSGTKEEKLEKIMIQKWIAIFPDGQEAWTEYRRTGYPKLHPVMNNYSPEGVTSELGIRRMHYPKQVGLSEEDQENLNAAVKMLSNGQDKASTRLWWDVENKHNF